MTTQYDLPPQALLQQAAARNVSGEELETFGKAASAKYLDGKCGTLNDAVVETIKSATLSPEQVKRVCEFANTDAFLKEFRKEGSATKYVTFNQGPANFSEVLKDLNDGGGGTVFDTGSGTSDYSHAPSVVKTGAARMIDRNRSFLEKTAGVEFAPPVDPRDQILEEAFAFDKHATALRQHRPLGEVEDLQDKLASARDATTSDIGQLETLMLTVHEDLFFQVKQACLSGATLGQIVQAWDQTIEPTEDLVKSAFAYLGPRLKEDGVFSWDGLGASLEKTAGASAVADESHPLVEAFGAYCEGVTKLAHLRAGQTEILQGLEKLTTFSKSVHEHYPEHV